MNAQIEHYNKISTWLHWLMAMMLFSLLVMGFSIDFWEKPFRFEIIDLHKSFGALAFFLALFRWYWRLTTPMPAPFVGLSRMNKAVAHSVQWLLMLLMLFLPLSGFLMSMFAGYGLDFFHWISIPGFSEKNKSYAKLFSTLHYWGGWSIVILITFHALGALKQHFYHKNNYLKRMLTFK
jgi:cytochrome b561